MVTKHQVYLLWEAFLGFPKWGEGALQISALLGHSSDSLTEQVMLPPEPHYLPLQTGMTKPSPKAWGETKGDVEVRAPARDLVTRKMLCLKDKELSTETAPSSLEKTVRERPLDTTLTQHFPKSQLAL